MKQEGFVREISDLQETVEWKDKKIGVRLPSTQRSYFFTVTVSLVHETDFYSSYFAHLKLTSFHAVTHGALLRP